VASYPSHALRCSAQPVHSRHQNAHFCDVVLRPAHATEKQAKWARQALYAIVTAVRPNAVALVDGFGFTDYLLNSALGRSDGDVYKCAVNLRSAQWLQFLHQFLHLGTLLLGNHASLASRRALPAGGLCWDDTATWRELEGTQLAGTQSAIHVAMSLSAGRCWRWRRRRRSTTARRAPPGRASCSRGWHPTPSSNHTSGSSCSSAVAAAVAACPASVPGSRQGCDGLAEFGIDMAPGAKESNIVWGTTRVVQRLSATFLEAFDTWFAKKALVAAHAGLACRAAPLPRCSQAAAIQCYADCDK
jgi:Acyl-CoA oxidase